MAVRQILILISLLAAVSVVRAQTSEVKPPDVGSSAESRPSVESDSRTCAAPDQAEILTDTMGVDFDPYLATLTKTVRTNWYSFMPPSVYPPILKQGRVSIEFFVQKDGKVKGTVLHASSGDVALDRAAWASITASSPFASLPEAFTGQRLGLRFFFYYNMDASRISVSPCMDVRVAAGATEQFTAVGKSGMDKSVMWRVSGPGCEKAACGTISEKGLYTAPVDVPNPATVSIEANLPGDASVPCKVKVTIVAANAAH